MITPQSYIDWRKRIFSLKGDLDPIPFIVTESQLIKAASTIGPAHNLVPLGGSFISSYRFDTSDGAWVLRVPSTEKLSPSLHVDTWAAQQADEAHVPTAIPTITDDSRYVAPFSYQIMSFVGNDGQLFDSLHRLHRVKMSGYGPIYLRGERGYGMFDTWMEYLTVGLADHIDRCLEIGALTPEGAEQAEELIREAALECEPVLLHGDLSPSNIIGSRITGWTSAICGDPIWDLANHSILSHPEPRSFTESYFGHVRRPHDFSRRFWLYQLRLTLAYSVHAYRFKTSMTLPNIKNILDKLD